LLRGATAELHADTGPVAGLLAIYARRVEHLRSRGIRFVGDDVVQRLRDSNAYAVRLAGVHGTDNYVVFLAPSEERVLACIGVDGAVANPDFEGSK
jgi:hypothetical protein